MPPLPAKLRGQWQTAYGLSSYDATLLTQDRETAEFFMELIEKIDQSMVKAAANLMTGDFAFALNRDGLRAWQSPVLPVHLAELLKRVQDGTISNKIAKEIFTLLWERGQKELLQLEGVVDQVIDQEGLRQISDTGAIEIIIDEVLLANTKSVEEYRSGKEKAFNALVGQIMKASKGKANPAQVNALLKQKLTPT
jgi:aspartyl-tRNA(Asn)/glutamyl-tRNA(Gln) amidotransferase subunit B